MSELHRKQGFNTDNILQLVAELHHIVKYIQDPNRSRMIKYVATGNTPKFHEVYLVLVARDAFYADETL